MAFTYDISTSRGQVRLKLGDTSASGYVFEDDEIDYFLSVGGTVNAAVAEGLRVLIADRARRAKSFSMQGLTLDDSKGLQYLRDLLSDYGGDLPTVAIVSTANIPQDRGFIEPTTSST